jgi:uncharacterized repeat protein (TIGR03806 family)
MRRVRKPLSILAAALAWSCSPSAPPDDAAVDDAAIVIDAYVVPAGPLALSEWGLFTDLPHQVPAADVIPYEVISPLFSDYATKHRFIRVPAGMQITIDPTSGDLVFPEGSVIVKTFGFLADLRDPTSAERLIETRLLVRHAGAWQPLVYLYDADMREAHLWQYGSRIPVMWIDRSGAPVSITYHVPDANTCTNCHGGADPVHLLGVRVRQLDRTHDYGHGLENELDHLVTLGVLASAPAPADRHPLVDPFGSAPLDARARSYLEANCANCHRPNGGSDQSGLWLGIDVDPTDPLMRTRLGFCKDPAAAGSSAGGRRYDIHPGDPDDSIMIYRVESEVPGVKMPELPTVLHHAEGAALLRTWISAMPLDSCTATPVDGGAADAGIADAGVADAGP